ncbi:MAG: D-alanine--D-alanine ligase [Sphingobacteriales bacterium]|nr:D-alanine--D-alanine ligase [Sphingobacteriales bacterium]
MSQKPNIAFVTGGYSTEAQISYKSAITIENNLDRDKYNIYKIDITPGGWFYIDASGNKSLVDKGDFTITDNGNKIKFDAVFIGIHGTPGEDGKLQGYFDLVNLPYTSCDALSSALTFNKRYTVAVAAFSGINVAKSVHLFNNALYDAASICSTLQFPVFVKPANGGSSIGMSRVNTPDVTELESAIQKAFTEDTQVLIEEYIKGREFTIGVYKNKGVITPLPMTEVFSKREFFDFIAKYKGESDEETPAKVDEHKAEKIRAAAKKIYQVFNCRGVIRIDFIYNEEKDEPFMLEINTVPGQSEMSIVPQQVRAMGGNLKDFYSAMIEEVLPKK